MTQKQINYFTMVQAVLKWLTDNATIWTGITAIEDQVSALQIIVTKLQESYLKQTENQTEGYTSNKDIAFENMETLAYSIAIKIRAYARQINNMAIFNAVNFSMSELTHGPEQDQIEHCRVIKNQASANIAAMPTYFGLTAGDITALQTAITTAEPLGAIRDDVRGEGIESTGALRNDFREMVKIFVKLDELVEAVIPADQHEFVNTYFATRRINDHKGGGGSPAATPPPTT